MKKSDVVNSILGERVHHLPSEHAVKAFAPSNIALCKYWGKRNTELNLPITSSLSISLGEKGSTTEISITDRKEDIILLNGEAMNFFTPFSQRLLEFLNLFRKNDPWFFQMDIKTNIPIAAGLASSASGFAALILALNQLFRWQLKAQELSMLARLGSGSASRSLWPGFVEWQAGVREDGMDSYGKMMTAVWPELCIGLLILNRGQKPICSRDAMQRTVDTSALYSAWPKKAALDLEILKESIQTRDFDHFGKTAESNALAMHGTMLASWPPISYFLPETMAAIQTIWKCRQEGLSIFFTQDAGPNLKLLFLKKDEEEVSTHFPLEIVRPFGTV